MKQSTYDTIARTLDAIKATNERGRAKSPIVRALTFCVGLVPLYLVGMIVNAHFLPDSFRSAPVQTTAPAPPPVSTTPSAPRQVDLDLNDRPRLSTIPPAVQPPMAPTPAPPPVAVNPPPKPYTPPSFPSYSDDDPNHRTGKPQPGWVTNPDGSRTFRTTGGLSPEGGWVTLPNGMKTFRPSR